MTSGGDQDNKIRFGPAPIGQGRGRPRLREIVHYDGRGQPVLLVTVPSRYAYDVLAAVRAAWRAGYKHSGSERYADPRWRSSKCPRCYDTEWHRGCREAGDTLHETARCEHCEVTVAGHRAEAAAVRGPWHQPGCPLFASRDPDAEHVIEVRGHLPDSAFRRIGELLGEELGRHKAWSAFYVFGPMTAERAGAVCAYLEDLGIAYSHEVTTRRTPRPAAPAARPRPPT